MQGSGCPTLCCIRLDFGRGGGQRFCKRKGRGVKPLFSGFSEEELITTLLTDARAGVVQLTFVLGEFLEEEVIKIFLTQGFRVFQQTTVLGMSVGEVMATFLTHARVGSVQQVVVVIWDQRAAGVVLVEGPVGVVH